MCWAHLIVQPTNHLLIALQLLPAIFKLALEASSLILHTEAAT